MPMKLISNKTLREFVVHHPDADNPLRAFRLKIEKGSFAHFADLRTAFPSVDKVGDLYVFNIGGNKYRLIASIAYKVKTVWIKAVLTHAEYDQGAWK